ncbi:MAG: hypothetical protein DRI86_15385 [Bacteroidetes bacterium]|nr:MAG: hypothetical protein DRI86_15385 [Bacteroidota bacterium]
MTSIKQYIISFLILISFASVAQTDIEVRSVNADCIHAIDISGKTRVNATAPKGKGLLMEIKSQKGDLFYFEKEHNTVWYSFIPENDAKLSFNITPNKPTDDYDFILFECNVGNCCEAIKNKTLKPIRSNISRTKPELYGVTGLNVKGTSDYVHEGKGNNYSKIVNVKKGMKYYLVLDNVYGGTGGHRIVFNYVVEEKIKVAKKKYRELSINVIDIDTRKPVVANITVLSFDEKYNKDTILQTQDSNVSVSLTRGVYYEVYSEKEDYLNGKISFRPIAKDSFIARTIELKSIKVGSSFNLDKVFFIGGTPSFAAGSQKALRKLYYTLKSNPKLRIQIQGHVNLPNGSIHKHSEEYYNKLSVDRAKAVYDYLIKRGIDRNRLEYRGFGYSQMIYPDAITKAQMEKNRRVEVRIIGN